MSSVRSTTDSLEVISAAALVRCLVDHKGHARPWNTKTVQIRSHDGRLIPSTEGFFLQNTDATSSDAVAYVGQHRDVNQL